MTGALMNLVAEGLQLLEDGASCALLESWSPALHGDQARARALTAGRIDVLSRD